MTGRIVKAISGFYYVYVVESGLYECKAKGVFRKDKTAPLVGDWVDIDIIDEEKKLGNVASIGDRANELIRPPVANIDQAIVIFAAKSPDPNLNLLDRFITMMEYNDIPVVIAFNKSDLVSEEDIEELTGVYSRIGYKTIVTCAAKNEGIEELRQCLKGKTSCVAGPSGVGKSSIINALYGDELMETGDISKKVQRGKNTTRHTQLIYLGEDSYIFDTPGFSSFYPPQLDELELYRLFREFVQFEPECKFAGCSHITENACGIKSAVEAGKIDKCRYDNYVQIFSEIKAARKY